MRGFLLLRSWLSFSVARSWLSFCVARGWLGLFLLCRGLSLFLLCSWLGLFMLLFLRVCRSNRSEQQDQNSGADKAQCFHLYFLHHQFQAPGACRVGRGGSDPNLLLTAKPLLGAPNTTARRLRALFPANCSLLHSFPCGVIQLLAEPHLL